MRVAADARLLLLPLRIWDAGSSALHALADQPLIHMRARSKFKCGLAALRPAGSALGATQPPTGGPTHCKAMQATRQLCGCSPAWVL